MAHYRTRFTIEIADIDGNVAVSSFTSGFLVDTSTVANLATQSGAFATALAAATNGKIVRRSVEVLVDEAQLLPGATPPTDAPYPSVTDGARLNFSNAGGSRASITVPAPTETCFLPAPQRDYVDPAGDAADLITFMKANATDAGGNDLNLYQGGIKVGRRARKRRPPKAGLS